MGVKEIKKVRKKEKKEEKKESAQRNLTYVAPVIERVPRCRLRDLGHLARGNVRPRIHVIERQ
jgi:hypothetical protein